MGDDWTRKMDEFSHAADFKFIRLSAICGAIAPISYVVASIIGGLLKPRYNPFTRDVSAIGVGGDIASYVMNIGGFLLCGILLLFFAQGLLKRVGRDETTKMILPFIIGISGSGFILTSFFPMNTSLHGFTGFFATFVGIAPFFSIFIFQKDDRWKNLWLFSLIIVVATVMIGVSLRIALPKFPGLAERMTIAPVFLWIEIIAFRLFKLAGADAPSK